MASKRVISSGGIAVGYDIAGALAAAGVLPSQLRAKRLRRMPHLFCRVLELPVGAESPVEVEESTSSFTFKVLLPPPLPEQDVVRAQVIQIVPGITKVCVTGAHMATALLDELDIPLWRFRLPASSLPEASTAACNGDGLLVLTVPKDPSSPPSLLHPHQVKLAQTPPLSLDVDHDPVKDLDESLHESATNCVGDECASLSGFKALSTSVDHAESTDVLVPRTSEDNRETADAHDQSNFPSFDSKVCVPYTGHHDGMQTDSPLDTYKSKETDRSNLKQEDGECGGVAEL